MLEGDKHESDEPDKRGDNVVDEATKARPVGNLVTVSHRGADDVEIERSEITRTENGNGDTDNRRELEKIEDDGENGTDKNHDPAALADGIGECIKEHHFKRRERRLTTPSSATGAHGAGAARAIGGQRQDGRRWRDGW